MMSTAQGILGYCLLWVVFSIAEVAQMFVLLFPRNNYALIFTKKWLRYIRVGRHANLCKKLYVSQSPVFHLRYPR
jgi:hypothetical protein